MPLLFLRACAHQGAVDFHPGRACAMHGSGPEAIDIVNVNTSVASVCQAWPREPPDRCMRSTCRSRGMLRKVEAELLANSLNLSAEGKRILVQSSQIAGLPRAPAEAVPRAIQPAPPGHSRAPPAPPPAGARRGLRRRRRAGTQWRARPRSGRGPARAPVMPAKQVATSRRNNAWPRS